LPDDIGRIVNGVCATLNVDFAEREIFRHSLLDYGNRDRNTMDYHRLGRILFWVSMISAIIWYTVEDVKKSEGQFKAYNIRTRKQED